jgi:hypothetical protein
MGFMFFGRLSELDFNLVVFSWSDTHLLLLTYR